MQGGNSASGRSPRAAATIAAASVASTVGVGGCAYVMQQWWVAESCTCSRGSLMRAGGAQVRAERAQTTTGGA